MSRKGITRLWRKWAGYFCLAAWAGVIALAVVVVCDSVRLKIGPRSVALATFGGGGSTVCDTLDLVRRATGSYFSFIYGIFGADGEALGFWMTTLGSKYWCWTVVRRRIGRSIERRRVCVGGGVVTCGTFVKGIVGWAHRWMAWWRVYITVS